jgi:hypothetical protein
MVCHLGTLGYDRRQRYIRAKCTMLQKWRLIILSANKISLKVGRKSKIHEIGPRSIIYRSCIKVSLVVLVSPATSVHIALKTELRVVCHNDVDSWQQYKSCILKSTSPLNISRIQNKLVPINHRKNMDFIW